MVTMFNVTFSFALADVPFHFIPKFFWEHEKKVKRLSVFWLTGFIAVDNDRSVRTGKDVYYQMPLTILCDSFTKSSEIMDIINENDNVEVFFEKISDYMDKNKEKLDWDSLCTHQKMSEGFIINHDSYVNWYFIFRFQELSDKFKKIYRWKLTEEQRVELGV